MCARGATVARIPRSQRVPGGSLRSTRRQPQLTERYLGGWRWSTQDVGSDGANGGRTWAAAARAWSATPPSPLALRGGGKCRQGRRGDDGGGRGRRAVNSTIHKTSLESPFWEANETMGGKHLAARRARERGTRCKKCSVPIFFFESRCERARPSARAPPKSRANERFASVSWGPRVNAMANSRQKRRAAVRAGGGPGRVEWGSYLGRRRAGFSWDTLEPAGPARGVGNASGSTLERSARFQGGEP